MTKRTWPEISGFPIVFGRPNSSKSMNHSPPIFRAGRSPFRHQRCNFLSGTGASRKMVSFNFSKGMYFIIYPLFRGSLRNVLLKENLLWHLPNPRQRHQEQNRQPDPFGHVDRGLPPSFSSFQTKVPGGVRSASRVQRSCVRTLREAWAALLPRPRRDAVQHHFECAD